MDEFEYLKKILQETFESIFTEEEKEDFDDIVFEFTEEIDEEDENFEFIEFWDESLHIFDRP